MTTPTIGKPGSPIPLDKNAPVGITVDFQSVHHAAFRLFTRPAASADWVLLKEGAEDSSFSCAPAQLEFGLHYEFMFFTDTAAFKAAVIIEQEAQTLVPVTAAGDAQFVKGDLSFS